MAEASNVTFDVLLGGKVTPQLLKSFKDLEELMKKQGATAKTINAIMGRAYQQTFDGMSKDAKKNFGEVEKTARHSFHEVVARAQEAQRRVSESFAKMRTSFEQFASLLKRPLEWIGLTGVLSAAGAALGGAELLKKGIEVHKAREVESAALRATLAGRGAGAEAPEWEAAAARIAAQTRVSHGEAMKMMTRLAVSGRFRTAEQAQQMAYSFIGLGGGTEEGAEAARAAYGKASLMMLAGKVRPTAIGAIGGGAGLGGALLQQLARDTGIPITDLAKQFAPAKVSRTGEVTGGALAGAKGIEALNKAIIELGQSRGFEQIKAQMSGMAGMFDRFGKIWDDFIDKIGEAFEDFLMPLANRVNEWLDSINFSQVFDGMIEKAQEWGQLIAAVWDTLLNTPVMKAIEAMWNDFWKSLTGGVELYGPWVETWNDNFHHELGTHMARHPTEAFYKLRDFISKELGEALNKIIEAFTWFKEHGRDVWWWIVKITEAFIALKSLEIAVSIWNAVKALYELALAITAITTAASGLGKGAAESTIARTGVPLLPAAGPLAAGAVGVAFTLGVSKGADILGNWIQQKYLPDVGKGQTVKGEEYKRIQVARDEARAHGASAQKLQRFQETLDNLEKSMTDQEKASAGLTGALLGHSPGLIPAVNDATSALSNFTLQLGSGFAGGGMMGMGAGGGAGGVSGAHFTEYGPSVPGDQPGGPTYDWNSYHHVGAWPGITGSLRAGDVALGYGAQAKYHVMPGQMFTDEYGRTWRFADRSGSKDPLNVDVFKGAMGGIVRRPTRALIGESGPEAVLPLSGAGAAAAGLGGVTINVNVAGNAHDPEGIAEAVERVIRQHWRRQAVV